MIASSLEPEMSLKHKSMAHPESRPGRLRRRNKHPGASAPLGGVDGADDPAMRSRVQSFLTDAIHGRLSILTRSADGLRSDLSVDPNASRRTSTGVFTGADQTPPPSRHPSTSPSSAGKRCRSDVDDSSCAPSLMDGAKVDGGSSCFSPATTPPPAVERIDTPNSVNWKFAGEALRLLALATREGSSSPACNGDASFTRSLYIQATAFICKGLPSDLSVTEKMNIKTSLPSEMTKVIYVDVPARQPLYPCEQAALEPRRKPSWLHRLVAYSIVQLFLLLQFLLPYIKMFVGHAYQYEREHRLAERLVSTCIRTVDELGRRGVRITHAILQMNDGKVGQVINSLTIWCLRGVTDGIHEGVSEGFLLLGTSNDMWSPMQ